MTTHGQSVHHEEADFDALLLQLRQIVTHRHFPSIDESRLLTMDRRVVLLLDLLFDSIYKHPARQTEPANELEVAKLDGYILALNILIVLGFTLADCYQGAFNTENFEALFAHILEAVRTAKESGKTIREVIKELPSSF